MGDFFPSCADNCLNAASTSSYCTETVNPGCICQSPTSDRYSACVQAACSSPADLNDWNNYMYGYCSVFGGFSNYVSISDAATPTPTAGGAAASATASNFAYAPATFATFTTGNDDTGAAATTPVGGYAAPSTPPNYHSATHYRVPKQHGLSKGARGGIGAAVTIIALAFISFILFLLRRRRLARQRRAAFPPAAGGPVQEVAQIQSPPPPPSQGPSDAGYGAAGQQPYVQQMTYAAAAPSPAFHKYAPTDTVQEVVADDEPPVSVGGNGNGGGNVQAPQAQQAPQAPQAPQAQQGHGESTILGQ